VFERLPRRSSTALLAFGKRNGYEFRFENITKVPPGFGARSFCKYEIFGDHLSFSGRTPERDGFIDRLLKPLPEDRPLYKCTRRFFPQDIALHALNIDFFPLFARLTPRPGFTVVRKPRQSIKMPRGSSVSEVFRLQSLIGRSPDESAGLSHHSPPIRV
jgi:hypothetical protein